MFKNLLVLLLSIFLLFSCTKKNKETVISAEPTDEEKAISIYAEAVDALKKGDSFYASKNLRKLRVWCLKANWRAKQVLWLVMQTIQEAHIQVQFFRWKDI